MPQLRSKRLKVTIGCIALNFAIFTLGLFLDKEPFQVGSGLAALNIALVGYIWGETSRPSKE